jgi:hypothetical protein
MKNPEQNPDSDAARAMQEVVGAWVAQDRRPVSAAERLKKIRATEPATARRTSKWPALAVAACVALMLGTAWVYTRKSGFSKERSVVVDSPATKEPVEKASAVAFLHMPVDAQLPAPEVLYRCPKSSPNQWTLVTKENPGRAGDLLQSKRTYAVTLLLRGKHPLFVYPETVLLLNGPGDSPAVELWRGRMQLNCATEPVELGLFNESGAKRTLSILPGDYVKASTPSGEAARAAGLLAGGGVGELPEPEVQLADVRTLKPEAGSVTEPRVAEPETHLDDAAANLLKTINLEFKDTPATDALNTLRDLLGVKMSFSELAAEKVAAKKVTMSFTEISGAEALAKFAEQLGLELNIRNGEVVFELKGEKQAMLPPAESNDAF